MDKLKQRHRRKEDVKRRAAQPNHMFAYCRAIGCRKPARAGTDDGLDRRFCRAHADHLQRHGSPFKKSYAAAQLNPYRRAAVEWLMANEHDRYVRNAIQRVKGLYDRAGPFVEAFRLRGKSPSDRARAAWARLRHHEVDPRVVLAVWLAVEMVIKDDPQPVRTAEFKRVQAAKVLHRLASGSHKHWPSQGVLANELHVYPASRGNVLRTIGAALEGAAEFLVGGQLTAIRRTKESREARGRSANRAHPRSVGVRHRRKASQVRVS